LLKHFLHKAFGDDLPVFVSSDYDSIAGGDVWFQTIIIGLKCSAVVIVLLSPDSNDRRWINFEAGVGVGANATVIPVVVHSLERGEVGHPLTNLQIRSLGSIAETDALFGDVARRIHRLQRAMIELGPLIKYCGFCLDRSSWKGVDWQGAFLATDGPFMKLPKVEPQTFTQSISDALREGGYRTFLARRDLLGQTLAKGYKIVYLTDRTSYRAEIEQIDVILTAKPESAA
jgi:hypothetical protein